MGQKVHPVGFRLGISKTWSSRWYASKKFPEFVVEDHKIRNYLKERLFHAGISRVEIERAANKAKVRIFTARPGIVIGKRGAEIENLRKDLEKRLNREIIIDIQEIRKPELDAQLVAENVAQQLIRRIAFRRAMKKAVSTSLKFGAQGIKIMCAGRLGGAEMGPAGMVSRGTRPAPYFEGRYRLRIRRSENNLRHHRGQGHHLQG